MTGKRRTRIILFLIVPELILVGALLFLRQPFMFGPSSTAKVSSDAAQGARADQNPLSASPSPTSTSSGPTNPGLTPPLAPAPITLVAPSPAAGPNTGDSAPPTLPAIPVVSPVSKGPSLPGAAPIIPANPGAQQAALSKGSRVVITSIGVDAPIVEMGYTLREENGQEVADWQVPQYAVGHMIGSANPGAQGNVVLSAHNNIYGSLFKKLYTLKVGDQVAVFNTSGAGFVYRVSQSFIVQELGAALNQRLANAQVLLPTSDSRITLVSCWPETDNSDRAIVVAELVGFVQ